MRRALPWLLLALLAGFCAWKLTTAHFDWASLFAALRGADLRWLALATLLIYSNNLTRAMRWEIFLRPAYPQAGLAPTAWWNLIGSQFMGFTGLAIFGRVGELIRPLLVARRTGLSFSSQIAVVAVERMFDLGAFATLFAFNLLLTPQLRTLPFHEMFQKVGLAIAGLTLALGLFVLAVRSAGDRVARCVQIIAGVFSRSAAVRAAARVLAFRDGLNVIASIADLVQIVLLSLVLWLSIALAYVAVMRAFPAPVSALSLADCLLLLGFSVVGGVVQLPGVGGGSQIGIIVALTRLFAVPVELATSAGILLWLVGSWSIVPAGLIYARVEGLSLGGLARTSASPAGRTRAR